MDVQISITRKGSDTYKIVTQDGKVITSTILYDAKQTIKYITKLLQELQVTNDYPDQDRNRR